MPSACVYTKHTDLHHPPPLSGIFQGDNEGHSQRPEGPVSVDTLGIIVPDLDFSICGAEIQPFELDWLVSRPAGLQLITLTTECNWLVICVLCA